MGRSKNHTVPHPKAYQLKITRGDKIIFDIKITNTKALKKLRIEESEDDFYQLLFQQGCIVYTQDKENTIRVGDIISVDATHVHVVDEEYAGIIKDTITRRFKYQANGVEHHAADIKRITYAELATEEQVQQFHKLEDNEKLEFLSLFTVKSRDIFIRNYDKRLPKDKFSKEDHEGYAAFLNKARTIGDTSDENPTIERIEEFLTIKKLFTIWKHPDRNTTLKSCGKKVATNIFNVMERYFEESELPEDYWDTKKEILDHYELK